MARLLTYIIVVLLAVSCSEEKPTAYTVRGKAGDGVCRIMVRGLDNRYEKADSIVTGNNGKFTYSVETDTIVPLEMHMPDGNSITLFAEPGIKAKVAFDSIMLHRWTVEGGGEIQALHDSITEVIETAPGERKKMETIEKFIENNPLSEVSIELLRRYLIEVPSPDQSQISRLIAKLGGILQDNEFLVITSRNINKKNINSLHKMVPSFTYTTADSCKEVTHQTFNKKHLLITMWATWDRRSREEMSKLRVIDEKIKSENFEILNIALDHDTAEWKRVLESDSIVGHNACDTKAWSSEFISKFSIRRLPFSILVSPYQRITELDVNLGNDVELIDSLVRKYDKSLEERKKKEKEKNRKLKRR